MSASTNNCPNTIGFVAINAAFLQEVKEAYSAMWESLRQLRESSRMQAPLSLDLNKWVSMLSELRSELGSEFNLEETYGYITQAVNPYIGPCVNPMKTRSQHAGLYIQLRELCEQVEEAQYRGTLMRDFRQYADEYFQFDRALQDHEREEGRLIEHGLGIAVSKSHQGASSQVK